MADIQGLQVSALASANVNVARHQIQALLTDPTTGAIKADLTGANAVNWPDVLTTLTAAQRLQLLQMILSWLLHTKAGL